MHYINLELLCIQLLACGGVSNFITEWWIRSSSRSRKNNSNRGGTAATTKAGGGIWRGNGGCWSPRRLVLSNRVIRACLVCGTGKSPDRLYQRTINFNSGTDICSFVLFCSFNVSTFPQSALNSCCLFVSFVLMTMSEIRLRSSIAARIFGPRAKVCAEASQDPWP